MFRLRLTHYTCMVLLQWADKVAIQQINVCVCMHGVILFASFEEAELKMHGSEVSLAEQNLTQLAE